ncbi:MAG: glycosyltransferase [Deltaproteobacteria bacterium]|nr:glycosyltransferase [Deltaproteobacteria bacterium]
MKAQPHKLLIIVPVYEDWESLSELVKETQALENNNKIPPVFFLVVNDGSVQTLPTKEICENPAIFILNLARNNGHQRAIAIALAYAAHHFQPEAVVVMDADGEDKPADIPSLMEQFVQTGGHHVVFAQRAKRSESLVFRLFYQIYKILFVLLTGKTISFGNFLIMPFKEVKRITHMGELWNSLPGAILKSSLLVDTVPLSRGRRYRGKSKMNFVSLVAHGLGAISVHIEVVAIRLLLLTLFFIITFFISILVVIFIKVYFTISLPGWASIFVMGLTTLLIQSFGTIAVLIFLTLNHRTQAQVIPYHDYKKFLLQDL